MRFDRYPTPAWADRDKIREIYKFAQRHGYHVDHEVPIHGLTVCGLHVDYNLKLLRPKLNIQKSNKWPPQDALFETEPFVQLGLFNEDLK